MLSSSEYYSIVISSEQSDNSHVRFLIFRGCKREGRVSTYKREYIAFVHNQTPLFMYNGEVESRRPRRRLERFVVCLPHKLFHVQQHNVINWALAAFLILGRP